MNNILLRENSNQKKKSKNSTDRKNQQMKLYMDDKAQ